MKLKTIRCSLPSCGKIKMSWRPTRESVQRKLSPDGYTYCSRDHQEQHWRDRQRAKWTPVVYYCALPSCKAELVTTQNAGRPRDYCDNTCKASAARARKRRNPAGAVVTAQHLAVVLLQRAAVTMQAAALERWRAAPEFAAYGAAAAASRAAAAAVREAEARSEAAAAVVRDAEAGAAEAQREAEAAQEAAAEATAARQWTPAEFQQRAEAIAEAATAKARAAEAVAAVAPAASAEAVAVAECEHAEVAAWIAAEAARAEAATIGRRQPELARYDSIAEQRARRALAAVAAWRKIKSSFARRAETARLRRAAKRGAADAERASEDPEYRAWLRGAVTTCGRRGRHGNQNWAGPVAGVGGKAPWFAAHGRAAERGATGGPPVERSSGATARLRTPAAALRAAPGMPSPRRPPTRRT